MLRYPRPVSSDPVTPVVTKETVYVFKCDWPVALITPETANRSMKMAVVKDENLDRFS